MWRKPLEGGGGEQASQDTLYFADRERSCMLVGVLTLLLAPLKRLSLHQGKSLALLFGVTDRRTGSEDFPEEIRTFKSKIKG